MDDQRKGIDGCLLEMKNEEIVMKGIVVTDDNLINERQSGLLDQRGTEEALTGGGDENNRLSFKRARGGASS